MSNLAIKQNIFTPQLVDIGYLNNLRSFIYKETGMHFEDNKNYYLESRIKQRMDILGLKTPFDYMDYLGKNHHSETQLLIEAITINETYFFRDFPQLQGFAEIVLPKYLVDLNSRGENQLKIWSAACSSGEEPYTLSIITKEILDDYKKFQFQIEATDIDNNILSKAQAALYDERSMKDTPTEYRENYFIHKNRLWHPTDEIKSRIKFKNLNLMNQNEMRKMQGFDFIFCRNVLIYFDDQSRKKVISNLYNSLKPGGYLFLGHSESVGRITAAFQLEKAGNFIVYRKPV